MQIEEIKHGCKCVYNIDEQGRIQGIYKEFSPSGRLLSYCTYKDNTMQGPFETYHNNGKIKHKGCYDGHLLTGVFLAYSTDGNLIQNTVYQHSQLLENKLDEGRLELNSYLDALDKTLPQGKIRQIAKRALAKEYRTRFPHFVRE